MRHTAHAVGIDRRELLQVGYAGALGLGLLGTPTGSAFARPADGSAVRAKSPKSVVLVWLTGGLSHHESFDPKPDAPAEIRGEFKPIATSVPGIQIAEHLPLLAKRAAHYALVRSLSHKENNHLVASHHVTTGHQQPGAFFDKVASRDDWPCYGATLNALRPRTDGVPTAVHLPWHLQQPPLMWPGQHAGFLGPKHDPWQLNQNPNAKEFRVENVAPAPGLSADQFADRRTLLADLQASQGRLEGIAAAGKLTDQQGQAFRLLTSGKVGTAFDLHREPDAVRDRYGRHEFGQSLLLARRLVQAGVPVVQANMGRAQNWDSHGDIFRRLKVDLLPPLDRAVSALLDDLRDMGLLDDTLVVVTGEFGRTPKVAPQNPKDKPGRDHWASCFTALFAGGGVRGGQVIGKSDRVGAFPATVPYSPDDLGATVYAALGIDPGTAVSDRLGRPVTLNLGEVIAPLYSGS
jgi:uncharacterized protein (DUF1501 family)